MLILVACSISSADPPDPGPGSEPVTCCCRHEHEDHVVVYETMDVGKCTAAGGKCVEASRCPSTRTPAPAPPPEH